LHATILLLLKVDHAAVAVGLFAVFDNSASAQKKEEKRKEQNK